MQSTSKLVIPSGSVLLTLTTSRVVLDALGLPGSAVPSGRRNEMPRIVSNVILEAEMVAFSEITGRIDGE